MHRTTIAAAAALLAFTTTPHAQTLRTDSAAQAIAIAGGGAGGGGGIDGNGGRTQRIVTVPGVAPPAFYGANPCSNSASGGGAGMGFGISIGGQWTEQECRDQEWFRFFHMAGQGDVATAYVCARYERIRQAFRDAGRPCPQDAALQPVSVRAPQAPPQTTAPTQRTPGRPDWCDTSSPAERRLRAECR